MKEYYAYRTGEPIPQYDYATLRSIVVTDLEDFESRGWFQSKLGKNCVDDPINLRRIYLQKIGHNLYPFQTLISKNIEEKWLFSLIEFLYESVAKPTETRIHQWANCGLHVSSADEKSGQDEFRKVINSRLQRYVVHHELNEKGEIWKSQPSGLNTLKPELTGDKLIDDRLNSAIRSFQRYGSPVDDRRYAIHDLADILEHLKKSGELHLPSKDESDLFQIANSFAIRHYNPNQKTEYDGELWLEWIYYSFLNAISLITKLKNREKVQKTS